eukprot:Sdes_comp19659_c0_seq3m11493
MENSKTSKPQKNPPQQSTPPRSIKTIYTAGRPPWYNASGQLQSAFIIGIAGGSASGKTTVSRKIIQELGIPWVVLLDMDSFYKSLEKDSLAEANEGNFNFDHPDSFDFASCRDTLAALREGKSVQVPIYDFNTHQRLPITRTVYGANVILFEGIMTFVHKELRDLMDLKIFVDTDSDIRLARRLQRDISERGRSVETVLAQYNKFVKPSFEEFISPSMKYADIVIPRGASNTVAIDLVIKHVQGQLLKRGYNFREQLANSHVGEAMPERLHVLEGGNQVRGIHTIVRNRDTSRDEFIFYSQRLMRLLIEFSLSFLPYVEKLVQTPRRVLYRGGEFQGKLCGVSIVRAGVTMEFALRDICKDIPLGRILIQTDQVSGEPQLHFCKLPKIIPDMYVLLMDATIATGAAALMAIRVLLDHNVLEENIIFMSLIAAPSGIHSVAYAFPRVRIVTTAVDVEVNDQFHILPGIGKKIPPLWWR